ncbi:MAG: hypothetical protein M0R40_00645 [Firmicutes bacterium]|nr:hypothetical protein [Bacillota bacterium]
MTIKDVFEKVSLETPIEQRRFFNYYNDSVSELEGLYGNDKKNLFKGEPVIVKSLSDESTVLPLYNTAIVDNILFLTGLGESHKGEFIRKAHAVYLKYWKDGAKGKQVKNLGW